MKKVFQRVLQLIFHPAAAWDEIAGEIEEGRYNAIGEYLYPLVSYCALLCFAVKLIAARVADSRAPMGAVIPHVFLEILGFFFVFIGGLYVSLFLMRAIYRPAKYTFVVGYPMVALLAYSMTLLIVLRTVGSIVEIFSFLGFPFQFYTLYIVWEGSKKVLEIPDNWRLNVSVVTALLLILFTNLIANFYESIIG